jgi:3-phenylpropionate/cinnamic acid dioxygenase small subunit
MTVSDNGQRDDDDIFARRYFAALRFLHHEAQLLDDRRLDAWLELLTEDIEYRIPTRINLLRSLPHQEFSSDSYHLAANYGALTYRIARLNNEYSYSEESPSRTRRMVGNIRPEPGPREGELLVRSNLLLFRGREDDAGSLLSAEREDTLRRIDGRLRLAARTVYLDHTSVPMQNLAIIL